MRNRQINGSTRVIPISFFFVALFYYHAVKNPVRPRKVSSPMVPITKRITPRAINSSTVMLPSLIRIAENWHRFALSPDRH